MFASLSPKAMPRSKGIATSVPAMATRAKKHECVRMRCLSRACPFRSESELSQLDDALADQSGAQCLETRELNEDDRADLGVDEAVLEDNASDSSDEDLIADPPEDDEKSSATCGPSRSRNASTRRRRKSSTKPSPRTTSFSRLRHTLP